MTAVLPDSFSEAVEVLDRRLTADEYESLPVNPRLELVDGVLHLMTPPTVLHQEVVEAIKSALRAVCPKELRIVREQELRLGDIHRRNPDLMVINETAYRPDGYSYLPSDVLLVVEVVSPGTQVADRIHKPGEYQKAGIAHYWRIETRPALALHTYQLGETGRYLETGMFSEGDLTAVPGLPWAKIAVADLNPE
jgi:Uma2 family endonuclease